MLTDVIEARITRLLESSRVRDMVVEEMRRLMNERPPDVTPLDYCTAVALYYLRELCRQTVGQCKTGEKVQSEKTSPEPSMKEILNALLSWSQYELLGSNLQMVKALGSAIAVRDTGTSEHNLKVTLYAARLAEKARIDEKRLQSLIKGSFLHDIGKIGISDATLLKSNKLTDIEFKQMQSHVNRGEQIIKGVVWLEDARDIILYHHERWDGRGYPEGLKKNDIPVNARIFMIVDVFDALTSDRPYKKAAPFKSAMAQMESQSGIHFDPRYFELFADIAGDLYSRYARCSVENLEREVFDLIGEYFYLDPRDYHLADLFDSIRESPDTI
ncbi:MAG: HD-GYP domain-containing protein [candidate division Zixibacteria bacterium]|nr:HD-GYP domain-containing protein [candidate division Zixibacteria bacterium]